MNYYISDLHLFHEASIRYDGCPFDTLEEMHDTILKNWNDTVTNHDRVSDFRYKQLFSGIYDYKELNDSAHKETYHLVLSHYPIFSWNRMNRGALLLYGHIHQGAEDVYFQKCISGMKDECRHAVGQDIRAYNVGCMSDIHGCLAEFSLILYYGEPFIILV